MRGRRAWTALATLGLAGCGGDADGGGGDTRPSGAWFVENALERGVDFVHHSGFETRWWMPEIIGSGAALFDYDGDGDLDLYCVQSGDMDPGERTPPGNVLYRNEGGGRFVDVTAAAGVGDTGYGMGCATGDFDADGDVDLYVSNYGPNVLYRNEGDGTFTDVTDEAGVGGSSWSLSCGFFDHDLDGDLDLFVTNYVNWAPEREIECRSPYGTRTYCSPNNYNAPARDSLYRNEGGGRFRDVSAASGLADNFGNAMGLALGDFDDDGRPDVYVANDGMANQLWINTGSAFEDRALLAGCAVNMQGKAEASMGVAMVDVDDDGDLDLHMTHLDDESNTFYVNRGGTFTDRTPQTGLGRASMHLTGFGIGFADFDCDGLRDIYVANGRVEDFRPYAVPERIHADPNQLFRGVGGIRFEELEPRGGVDDDWIGTSRGAAFGDIDEDGDVDVVVVDRDARVRILENVASGERSRVRFRVLDERGVDAVGARVAVRVGERVQYRTVQTCYSYCSANDPRVHFGLAEAARVDEVVVRWLGGGDEESFGAVEAGGVWLLRQGTGRAERAGE